MLYCPDAVLSLVGLLRRLSGCRKEQRAPDVYVASTVRNPETPQLFTAQLGQAGIRWEVVPPHDRALFPYEEQWEVVILKLAL